LTAASGVIHNGWGQSPLSNQTDRIAATGPGEVWADVPARWQCWFMRRLELELQAFAWGLWETHYEDNLQKRTTKNKRRDQSTKTHYENQPTKNNYLMPFPIESKVSATRLCFRRHAHDAAHGTVWALGVRPHRMAVSPWFPAHPSEWI